MSQELRAFDHDGAEVVDSREVAAMVEKQHKNLLADIRGYIEMMEDSGELKIQPSDFFIPSTYITAQNKAMPHYLITKKGCDMIANKLTGKKGVLFTAAYVTAFEDMRKHLQGGPVNLEASKAARAEAMLNNSKARLAAEWRKLAELNPIPEYRQICAHYASAVMAGKEALPLPEVRERTYTATEVGRMLGGVSSQKIGSAANKFGLKTPKYGVEVWDKAKYCDKQVPTWRYNDKGVARLREILNMN